MRCEEASFPKHGTDIIEAREKVEKGRRIYDFSVNVNPFGPPSSLLKKCKKNILRIKEYPDIKQRTLRKALAQYHGIGEEFLIFGNGSCSMIYSITALFRGAKTLILEPTFTEYRRAAKVYGCNIHTFFLKEEENFSLNPSFLDIIKEFELIFICNPNNPTGTLIEDVVLHELIKNAQRTGAYIVVDEAFLDFTDSTSLSPFTERFKNLIILRSLTKFYTIPGLRAGYVVSHPFVIKKLSLYLPPWTANVLCEEIVDVVFDEEFRIMTKEKIKKEREYLQKALKKMEGIKVYPSSVNFFLFLAKEAPKLYQGLLKKGFLLRECKDFLGLNSSFLRIAVKRRRENKEFIKTLREVWQKLS